MTTDDYFEATPEKTQQWTKYISFIINPDSKQADAHDFIPFNFAIDASVGIFMGQTSMQDNDFEQSFPK